MSAVLVALLAPALAFAQSGQIEAGLGRAMNWLTVIAGICSIGGFAYTAIKLNAGDPDAKQQGINSFVAAVLAASAAGLCQLIKSWF